MKMIALISSTQRCYGFLSFDKNMGKNIDENISENIGGKYSQKLLDHAKQC